MATRSRPARRSKRWGVERLEGRTLLNGSIDIAADGSLLYRTDSGTTESLRISVSGTVYTFEVQPTNNPIDVQSNVAGLTVTGSGSRLVTVEGPSRLRIEVTADGQSAQVASTTVPTAVIFQADAGLLTLGGGSGGVQALSGAISVSAGAGAELNKLVVDDGSAAYEAGTSPAYVVSAGSITTNDPIVQERFVGISYSGVTALTVRGTSNASSASALYVVQGTAAGVTTTIDATAGPAHRDFSIQGTSAGEHSSLFLNSAGSANVWISAISSHTQFNAGGGQAKVWIESVRGSGYGLNGNLVLDNAGGGVDVSIANYWNSGPRRGNPNWFLGFDPGAESEYAVLRDATNSNVVGLFFQPEQVHSLTVNAQGHLGASLLVDFRDGDAIPFGPAAGRVDDPRSGLIYLGARGVHPGSSYALGLVGAPPSGPFSSQSHAVFPLFRGLIELEGAGGVTRNLAYQLDAGAPVFEDAATVLDYRWFYDIMDGAVDGVRTLPNGAVVSAVVDSTLAVVNGGLAITSQQALGIFEANPEVFLARYLVSAKTNVRLLRGWSLGTVTTVVNYQGVVDEEGEELPVEGLASLSIEDVSPAEAAVNDVVRLQNLPVGIATYVAQNFGDDAAIVSIPGIAGTSFVGFNGGPGENTLYIDAGGLQLNPSSFREQGGALYIPPLDAEGSPIAARNYAAAEVYNSSTPAFALQPVSIPAQGLTPLEDVTAGYLNATLAGFSPVGLTAVIAWGDGSGSLGKIEAVPGVPGTYRVVGSHTYPRSGVFTPRLFLSGAGTAMTEVAGVEITFQISSQSGSDAPAPALTGRLAAASDSGVSDSDGITNIVRPEFTGFSELAGAWIDVYATTAGGGTLIHLGSGTADASGAWRIASTVALADGAYVVQAVSASTTTWANGSAVLTSPLVIDTMGPRVWTVDAAPLRGEVAVVFRDFGGAADSGSGLDLASLRNAASYALATATGVPQSIAAVQVLPGSTNGPQTVTLRAAGRLRGDYLLTAFTSAGRPYGIRDIAGNPLDGTFTGRFPSGGSNIAADFRARLTLGVNNLQAIRPV